jgi:hypothetical protein
MKDNTVHIWFKILTMLLVMTSFGAFGQSCDTLEGKTYNCIDIKGERQGHWKEQRKIVEYSGYSGYGSARGCQYFEKFHYQITAEGVYSDNNKTGTWKYYNRFSETPEVEREITYKNDESIIEKSFFPYTIIEANYDSSIISGYTIHNVDTLTFAYSNKKGLFKLGKDKIILSFDCPDISKFEYEMLHLKYGWYAMDVRLLKH